MHSLPLTNLLFGTHTAIADFFFCGVMSNFSSMLEMALEILEEQSMRRGQYLRDYWYVSAACSFVEMNLDPERTATCKLQSTERVARLYKRILGM